jgi:hypothetical protein
MSKCLKAFALFGVLFSSCGKEKLPVERKEAIRYYLNQREYESAIILIRQELAVNLHDNKLKLTYASALSGSVGLDTIDCFEILKNKFFDKPFNQTEGGNTKQPNQLQNLSPELQAGGLGENVQTMSPKSSSEEKRKKSIGAIESEMFNFSRQAAEALEIAFKLPYTSIKNRDRIMLALSVLLEIDKNADEYLAAQLYSGILSMVQFLNYFRDGFPVDEQKNLQFAEV